MLTTKKRSPFRQFSRLALLLAALAGGCGDPGARALLEGRRLIEEGRHAEAAAILADAADRLPQHPQAWNYQGIALHHAGQFAKAGHSYRQALQLNRNAADVRYNLGWLYFEQNQFAEAADQFAVCIQLDGKNTDAHLRLGLAQLRQARRLAGAEKTRWLAAARTNLETVCAVSPSAEIRNALGVIDVLRGRSRDSLAFFNLALQQDKHYAPALLNLAVVYHTHLNERRVALQKYREYLAARPRSGTQKQVEQIALQLDQELNPSVSTQSAPSAVLTPPAPIIPIKPVVSPPIKPEKIASNTSPISTVPAPTPASNHPPTQSFPSPVKPAPTAVSALPQFPRYAYRSPAKPVSGRYTDALTLYQAGTEAQRTNDVKKAVECFKQATRQDPAFFEAYFKLGLLAYQSGDLPACLAAYETALAIRPDDVRSRYNFALALQKANHPQDAASELEKTLTQSPLDVRLHLALANLYARPLQKTKQAREHYLRVLELDSRHPEAMNIRYWLSANP